MKANTAGFRLLPSYYNAVRDLPDAERLLMYDAIIDYGFGNEVGDLPPLLNGYFQLMRPTLDRSIRFEAKQIENGSKGGRPPKVYNHQAETQEKPRGNPEETQAESKGNLAIAVAVDNDFAVGQADKPPRASRFSPPSVEEVLEYCLERKNHVDAQRFVDFYTAKGWLVGKSKMRDWRACVRTWEKTDGRSDISTPEKYTFTEGESL